MDLVTHFQMLARYNRIANERLFAACDDWMMPSIGSVVRDLSEVFTDC
jgi:uncharacterized damage-inducible protein DinB